MSENPTTNPKEDVERLDGEYFLYHRGTFSGGPHPRAVFSCANDALMWQRGNEGQPYADLFFLTNRKGEPVTIKDQQHHPGHAYAILDAIK